MRPVDSGSIECIFGNGRRLRYAVDLVITIDLFGSCCVYQVIIARTIKQLVEGTDDVSMEGNPPIRVYIIALLIPCILLCMILSLKYLAPFSLVADAFIGMAIVVSMVMIVGFFGYWGFGEKSKSPVTVNFPWETFPVILKVFMALMVYVTFALNFWVPFELIGSFCLSNMGFIFPAFIELSLDWESPGLGFMKWRLIKFIIILIFGTILCVVGTVQNVKELIKEVFLSGD
ncbi:unnamed protein product [Diatraea saccharalis]|uniref:Amino acid transporter transmembrane domain-containing protein n=1 Tax=Diatraea saccharalis TaxID=40085 RepID=A0A9N9R634_9NEOP|nr:unnamed protein product [Diatraea saccharalis]